MARAPFTRALVGIGWLIVLVLLIVALCRVFAWDDLEPLAVMNALTPWLYLPVWLVVLGALVSRTWALLALSLLAVGAQIGFAYPELAAASPPPGWTAHAPTLRLLDANVYYKNPSMAGYASQIESEHPDLVALEEAGPADFAALSHNGALASLPYHYVVARHDPWAFVLASRYRLVSTTVISLYGRPLVVKTTVHSPGGPLHLWVLHTVAPLPGSFEQWQGQLAKIAELVSASSSYHLVIVGDFNATWQNRGFRHLLDLGLTDAAAARGEAFDMTWTQHAGPIPPFVRIDHVLTGKSVAVTSITTAVGQGSDHRDLFATIALRTTRRRA